MGELPPIGGATSEVEGLAKSAGQMLDMLVPSRTARLMLVAGE